MRDSNIGRITGTWGGILSGIAALITAVTLSIIDTAGDKAEKADDKAEMVLDLFRDRFNAAQSERERIQRELEYQREMNAKLFRMITELKQEAPVCESEVAPPVPVARPVSRPSSPVSDSLEEALENLPPEDRLDLPAPPPEPAPIPVQAQLPATLEDLLPKK